MINYRDTIIAQYANSPTLQRLLEDFNDNVDPRRFWEEFIEKVWDIDTAGSYGLNIWGQIVGVDRVIKSLNTTWFGFREETLLLARPFSQTPGNGAFWDGVTPLYGQLSLDDTTYRQAILAKAAANISDGSIASLNKVLMMLFAGKGKIYVRDNRNMSFTIVSSWLPTTQDASLLIYLAQVIRPAGVEMGFEWEH
ncbi:DUF2612 domain-containing protein [Entomobacter blattae]|uniref:DUF2612 domain-containing protein n=1 Tax=Entomobacter blattae TaxID=2762277 RepID=A0A7H1NU34_9PROT|nr:DUF2612 domain-containing protein [Entomobacter blattae]QNT79294.1 hypothetical protein JGUZn3_20910 [Entomobacter blattae]